MKLTVPVIWENKYINFLKNKDLDIGGVYFPLLSGPVMDARIRTTSGHVQIPSDILRHLDCFDKYCLLNTRFIHPGLYTDDTFINQLLDDLEYLHAGGNINGIVFSDGYLLNALSSSNRSFLSEIQAVPGINMMIDSEQKAFSIMDFIEQTRFRLPEKLVLDRSLNRDMDLLETTVSRIKNRFRNLRIELLANEGCLYHCPFKFTHDAQTSLANTGLVKNLTHRMNNTLGCHAYFFRTPHVFLKSPFIRPEDVSRYEPFADSIKLCGRTLGVKFLCRLITAYKCRSFQGNLFNLMDASNWLSDLFFLDNKMLDPGFFDMLTGCTRRCKTCTLCTDLFNRVSKSKPITLKPYEDYL